VDVGSGIRADPGFSKLLASGKCVAGEGQTAPPESSKVCSMSVHGFRRVLIAVVFIHAFTTLDQAQLQHPSEEVLINNNLVGHSGGRLVVSLRSEPKTLNPVTSTDISSREVIAQMAADLIHINRLSQQTESALAKSWNVSPDGLRYTLQLRRGLHFSDGHPVDADDVIFSFKVYLDESVNSPQRDLLVIHGKSIRVERIDAYSVAFHLARPYSDAERLFDSIAILPRHLLEDAYKNGKLSQTWGLGTSPPEIAGLGPFRLKEYVAGQRITLERNPYYWKMDQAGRRLPYLDQITFLFVANSDAEVIRFQAGETDIINRISAEDYAVLEKDQGLRSFHLFDLGPSLEFNFLFFNMNTAVPAQSSGLARKQAWFREVKFRQAVSLGIDREAMTRIVYRGRGTPLWTPVTPASNFWMNMAIPHPARSVAGARKLLGSAGFSWKDDGTLLDGSGLPVEFSIISSASNLQRTQMATMIQADLKDLGIRVQVVPLEFHSVLDRIFQTHDYEAAVLGLGAGDVDPNSEMNIWLSSGNDHVWDIGEPHPATSWEAEIDQLMENILSTRNPSSRKLLYDRVQEILAEDLPVICLASPNILVGAKDQIANFKPATLDPHTLWNSQELFFRGKEASGKP
jgi:peptide/nickel transport system substrate-binding protein